MILALATGWTPDVLAELPLPFRAACHWVLYGKAICGEQGLDDVPMPPMGAAPEVRLAVTKARLAMAQLREILYPEDASV